MVEREIDEIFPTYLVDPTRDICDEAVRTVINTSLEEASTQMACFLGCVFPNAEAFGSEEVGQLLSALKDAQLSGVLKAKTTAKELMVDPVWGEYLEAVSGNSYLHTLTSTSGAWIAKYLYEKLMSPESRATDRSIVALETENDETAKKPVYHVTSADVLFQDEKTLYPPIMMLRKLLSEGRKGLDYRGELGTLQALFMLDNFGIQTGGVRMAVWFGETVDAQLLLSVFEHSHGGEKSDDVKTLISKARYLFKRYKNFSDVTEDEVAVSFADILYRTAFIRGNWQRFIIENLINGLRAGEDFITRAESFLEFFDEQFIVSYTEIGNDIDDDVRRYPVIICADKTSPISIVGSRPSSLQAKAFFKIEPGVRICVPEIPSDLATEKYGSLGRYSQVRQKILEQAKAQGLIIIEEADVKFIADKKLQDVAIEFPVVERTRSAAVNSLVDFYQFIEEGFSPNADGQVLARIIEGLRAFIDHIPDSEEKRMALLLIEKGGKISIEELYSLYSNLQEMDRQNNLLAGMAKERECANCMIVYQPKGVARPAEWRVQDLLLWQTVIHLPDFLTGRKSFITPRLLRNGRPMESSDRRIIFTRPTEVFKYIVLQAVSKLGKRASQEFVNDLDAINQSYIERLPSVCPLE